MSDRIWSAGQDLGGIRRFILLRHGEPEGSNLQAGISPEAVAQIRMKSPEIEQRLFKGLPQEPSYTVFSSHRVRAVETAIHYFKSSKNAYWIKSNELFCSQNWQRIAEFIHTSTEEVAVIIAHLDELLAFPPYYCNNYLDTKFSPLEGRHAGYLCGVVIDREDKTCDPI